MPFNSIEFALFLPLVFFIYWFVVSNSLKHQNLFVLLASYFFYGLWDYQFLLLIIISSAVDFVIGLKLIGTKKDINRKYLLGLSLIINIGLLGCFKYYNFFIDSFVNAFTFFGMSLNASRLEIILPVGISFYTFQSLSYTIDIYRRKIQPTKKAIEFFAFISFFPQLIAGPIERASNLLPQFQKKRTFDANAAADGMRQILLGLFKKIVIADNCAFFADRIFDHSLNHSGSTLILGAIFFSFQIYGDFSGYSDIAIGTARLFGFRLMQNFKTPYFSRDIAEFWRRWHISLSTWFRDYLYIPLGGSRGGTWFKIRNVLIIFIISGFWHGANWTFIFWGIINAFYFIPIMMTKRNRLHLNIIAPDSSFPSIKELFQVLMTYSLTVLAWIFFRAEDLNHAFNCLSSIFSYSTFSFPDLISGRYALTTIFFIGLLLFIEWIGRKEEHALSTLGLDWRRPYRYLMYYIFIAAIVWYGGEEQQFIYFQF